jgi:hypothetical protein
MGAPDGFPGGTVVCTIIVVVVVFVILCDDDNGGEAVELVLSVCMFCVVEFDAGSDAKAK